MLTGPIIVWSWRSDYVFSTREELWIWLLENSGKITWNVWIIWPEFFMWHYQKSQVTLLETVMSICISVSYDDIFQKSRFFVSFKCGFGEKSLNLCCTKHGAFLKISSSRMLIGKLSLVVILWSVELSVRDMGKHVTEKDSSKLLSKIWRFRRLKLKVL